MKKATPNSLLLCVAGLAISTVGGMAITRNIAGRENSINFVQTTVIGAVFIFLFQLIIYPKARRELVFECLYVGSMSFVLIWFFLSVSLPILWVDSIDDKWKGLLILLFFVTSVANIKFGYNLQEREWNLVGKVEFQRLYNQAENTVDLDAVTKAMKIEYKLLVPGMPERYSTIFSCCLIGLMLIGLNFRNIFPVFSVLAWGIPSLIIASLFVQIGSYNCSQAYKIRAIQKCKSVTIKSGW